MSDLEVFLSVMMLVGDVILVLALLMAFFAGVLPLFYCGLSAMWPCMGVLYVARRLWRYKRLYQHLTEDGASRVR